MSAEAYDESRLPLGHKYEDGRIARQNKVSSGWPEGIWAEIWVMVSAKETHEAKAAKMLPLASPMPTAAVASIRSPAPYLPVIVGKSGWPHLEKLGHQ